MSKFSNTKRIGLQHFCVIAIVCAAFTAPAVGQRPAQREDRDQIDAASSASDDEKALLKAIEEQRRAAEAQRAEAEEQYRRAMSDIQKVRRRDSAEAQAQMAKLKEQLEAAHAQLAELAERHQHQQQQARQTQAEPLPENTVLRVYQLQHAKPQKLAEVLGPIFRNNAPRIAVDERANSLVVAGNERQLSIVEELAQTLDREIPEIRQENRRETLQARVLWLLDIDEGQEPADRLVSPEVVEALQELGFEQPKVVCQQVTTMTLGEEDRDGQFHFDVPVLIKSRPWQFEGQGWIEPLPDDRFSLRFDLRFHTNVQQRDGGGHIHKGQLGGSIYTPLGHYTVMGTTTFVATAATAADNPDKPVTFGEEASKPRQQQHLSAFVLYLDRAKEFPASSNRAENRTDLPR